MADDFRGERRPVRFWIYEYLYWYYIYKAVFTIWFRELFFFLILSRPKKKHIIHKSRFRRGPRGCKSYGETVSFFFEWAGCLRTKTIRFAPTDSPPCTKRSREISARRAAVAAAAAIMTNGTRCIFKTNMVRFVLVPERNKSCARDIRTIKGVKYYVEWIIQNNRPTHVVFFFQNFRIFTDFVYLLFTAWTVPRGAYILSARKICLSADN